MALHELFTIPFLKAVFENVIDQLIKKDIFINGALFIHRPITLISYQYLTPYSTIRLLAYLKWTVSLLFHVGRNHRMTAFCPIHPTD